MNIKTAIILAAAVIVTAGTGLAGETNFKPANMSGDTPAVEAKKVRPVAPKHEGPGFWQKEGERSGLSRFNPLNLFKKRDSAA